MVTCLPQNHFVMAIQYGCIAEAKNKLPELIRAMEGDRGIIITRHGKPVAQLFPTPPSRPQARLFSDKDRIRLLPGMGQPDRTSTASSMTTNDRLSPRHECRSECIEESVIALADGTNAVLAGPNVISAVVLLGSCSESHEGHAYRWTAARLVVGYARHAGCYFSYH